MLKRLLGKTQSRDHEASPANKHRDPPQIKWKHVWTIIETQHGLGQSPFGRLPTEILLRIFQYLSVPDLCHISLVCRHFKMIADQDNIWKLKCNISLKLHSKSFKQMYMDWMYAKYLRNDELEQRLKNMTSYFRLACVVCLPPEYPVRPTVEHWNASVGGFHQHPNSSKDMTITLSVDIDKTSQQLLYLLEKAAKFEEYWYNPAALKQMITRYYRFMQLKALYYPNVLLIPTLDIEIVWQTHLLRPEMYRADCLRLFRHVVDHSLVTSDIEYVLKEQAFNETCQFYEERFKEKYCELPLKEKKIHFKPNHWRDNDDSKQKSKEHYSHWDQTFYNFSSDPPKQYENPFSFTENDILVDGRWLNLYQKFMNDSLEKIPDGRYYQSLSDFNKLSNGVLLRLKKSYERFLYMAAKYPLKDSRDFVPPTYAIDLMWHAHMQEPLKYIADCVRLVGYVIVHSPWPVIEDGTMKKEKERKDKVWKDEFQMDITVDHLYNTCESIFEE